MADHPGDEAAGAAAAGLKDKIADKTDHLLEKTKLADTKDRLHDKAKQPPGGYDATPLPQREPGYTVRFTFHRAANLPVADLAVSSSDPYLTATLTADLPTRHKEDPAMVHRTRTVHGSTAPVWDEDWVVAHVPASGFRLKCRLYDEDAADNDDRLGNVTVEVARLGADWPGLDHAELPVRKRMGSKRAYLLKAAAALLHGGAYDAPTLTLSVRVLGRSDAPGGRMYTLGPTTWVRHFSPMIGRLTHTRVNKDESADADADAHAGADADAAGRASSDRRTKKYDFQANEIQLQGPVPPQLYHRYVEFRPLIGRMFTGHGLRGRLLHLALHKQHNRVYNYSRSTEYGAFAPCSEAAALQFLRLAHFDEGGRLFTYVLLLDGLLRFTETGKEFGIDMLSKHSMHADVATYIAYSGEFFIRRLARPVAGGADAASPDHAAPDAAADPDTDPAAVPTHPAQPLPGGPPASPPPPTPSLYQLIIDNGSGTYRPDKAQLPHLQAFLARNLPGLGIVARHWEDEDLQAMKAAQAETKKREGAGVRMVLNRSPTASSFSSDDESRLSSLGRHDDDDGDNAARHETKKERAWALLEDPRRLKELAGHKGAGSGSANANANGAGSASANGAGSAGTNGAGSASTNGAESAGHTA